MTHIPLKRELVERVAALLRHYAPYSESAKQAFDELRGRLTLSQPDTEQAEAAQWQYRDANDDGTWSAWLGCDKRLASSQWREVRALYAHPPATPPSPSGEPAHVPHTCAGFIGAFTSMTGFPPTQQEVWDGAIRSWRDLNPDAPTPSAVGGLTEAASTPVITKCSFSEAWRGPCGCSTVGTYCDKHAATKCCVCGAQATRECDHTGQFVCGAPLCDSCEGHTDTSQPGGAWGFMNHGHRGRALESALLAKIGGGKS